MILNQLRSAAEVARTLRLLARAGVVAPVRPDHLLRMALGVLRYGLSIPAGYAAGAARHPDRIAIVDEQGALSYAELHARTDRLARSLATRGIRPGVRIGVACRNHRGPVELIVAAGKLGADIILLNTSLSARQVADVVAELGVRTVVADDDLAELLTELPPDLPRLIAWHPENSAETIEQLIAAGGKGYALPVRPPPGRLIVLTAGTTGTPKGARRPQPHSILPVGAILSRIPLREAEPVFLAAPLFHTWGHAALHLAVLHGAPVVMRRRFDRVEALRSIAEHGCRTMVAVPVMLQRILELPEAVLARHDCRLRVVAVSGSALPPGFPTAFMDRFGDVLYNLYGSTEVSCVSIADPSDLRAAPGTAGRPLAGTRLAILDDAGTPVPAGAIGRVFVSNDMLFEGYTRVGAQIETRDGMLATGDIGRLDAAGRLHLLGRFDDIIISGGENVHPGQVEQVLSSHPEIREAAAVGVPDAEYGQRLAAYVVRAPDSDLDADTVRSLVRQRLARFAVPRDVVFVDELPHNATGKIVRRELGSAAGG